MSALTYLTFFVFAVCYLHAAHAASTLRSGNVSTRSRPKTETTENESIEPAVTGECPEPEGFFPDPYQCDKYFQCKDNVVVAQKLCPDGMVFNDFSPTHEKCDLPFNIDCSKRPELQDPQPTNHCPRLNGFFYHENASVCNKFYYCVDGKFNMITCPEGLVYNQGTGTCLWPDEAKKKGCTSEELFKFSCPKVDSNVAAQHPRYPDPEDCQYFYVCINGEVPRRSGCKLGQVFNDKTGICDWPKYVPDCSEWYKGILTEDELEALEHPPLKVRNNTNSNIKRQKTKSVSTEATAVRSSLQDHYN